MMYTRACLLYGEKLHNTTTVWHKAMMSLHCTVGSSYIEHVEHAQESSMYVLERVPYDNEKKVR